MPSDQPNKIIIYQDDDEVTRVSVRFAEEDLWLTQNQLAEIYCTTQENISMHVTNIYKDGELEPNRTNKKFLLVRQEGTRQVKRNIDHYNLDMIIALGYRVQSQVATRFRRWATQRLHEYIQKGFALDDERLKQGGNRYMLYLEKYNGYLADVPNIEFVRCDGEVFAYDELTSASMTAGHNMITITGGQGNFPLAYIDTDST